MRQLPKLGEGGAQFALGFVEACEDCGIWLGAKVSASQAKREREADELLLRSVVEISLEPSTLHVAALDDPRAGRAKVIQLGPRLGLQPLVLERKASRRGDLLDKPRVLEEAWSM
jgi:hypothetical protein